jgi:hypothetical protein
MEAGPAHMKAATAKINMANAGGAKMALEKELETYKKNLPEIKAHEGKYVLIQGDKVVDFFTSYDDALKQGYKQFGPTPFLVKQVLAVEPVFYVTRPINPVHKAS